MKKEIEKIEKIESIKELKSLSERLDIKIVQYMIACGLCAILGLEAFHYGRIEAEQVENAEYLCNAMVFGVGSSIAGIILTGAGALKNIILKDKTDKKIRRLSGGK